MKQLVAELLTISGKPTTCLQRINEALLKSYQLSLPSGLTFYPKEVEIYYVNPSLRPPYVDANMHCLLDPKTDAEIWKLQSARYGRLYIHRKGLGGVDICLSDSSDFALCCTIKAAEVDGTTYWSQLRVRNALLDACCQSAGEEPTKEHRQQWADRLHAADSPVVLQPREHPLVGDVYHLRRKGLRRCDLGPCLLPAGQTRARRGQPSPVRALSGQYVHPAPLSKKFHLTSSQESLNEVVLSLLQLDGENLEAQS